MKFFFTKQSKTACRSITLLLGLLLLGSCRSDLTRHAGDNASELERVLLYYKYVRWDSQKYEAAKFLIENMKFHYSQGQIVSNDSLLEAWRAETDSIYEAIVAGHTLNDFPWDSLRVRQKNRRAIIEAGTMPDVENDMTIRPDMETLTFKFLTDHIDHAFKVWRESKYTQNLTFDEFKEYILPYRSVKMSSRSTSCPIDLSRAMASWKQGSGMTICSENTSIVQIPIVLPLPLHTITGLSTACETSMVRRTVRCWLESTTSIHVISTIVWILPAMAVTSFVPVAFPPWWNTMSATANGQDVIIIAESITIPQIHGSVSIPSRRYRVMASGRGSLP